MMTAIAMAPIKNGESEESYRGLGHSFKLGNGIALWMGVSFL